MKIVIARERCLRPKQSVVQKLKPANSYCTDGLLQSAFSLLRNDKLILLFVLLVVPPVFGGEGNKFVYTQLRYDGAWDPYPHVYESILEMVKSDTNIPFIAARKIVTLADGDLFEYPFMIVEGNAAFKFNSADKNRLKTYIDRGGLIFFDDTLADPESAFKQSLKSLLLELYPDKTLDPLPTDHAVYRSFFLLRSASGRKVHEKQIEGLTIGGLTGGEGRTAILYSSNDLLGAWARDPMGNYAFSCEPGGEAQRWEAFKMTINIIYFSLTGTYKKDAIHQPFLERKLGN